MFCSCSAGYQEASPNTVVCPVCLGMPGVLPVINRRAVELVVRTGLALGCRISPRTKFDRKNYPYPDLMKGYQISQYDMPIALDGGLDIDVEGQGKCVGITRVHLEEDVAKLMHRSEPFGEGYSLLDVNRAGVPLMEVVSEPDMRSAGGGQGLPDAAALDPSLHRRQQRQYGRGQLPLRRQHKHTAPGRFRARLQGRSQEHEQLPLGLPRPGVRG